MKYFVIGLFSILSTLSKSQTINKDLFIMDSIEIDAVHHDYEYYKQMRGLKLNLDSTSVIFLENETLISSNSFFKNDKEKKYNGWCKQIINDVGEIEKLTQKKGVRIVVWIRSCD